MSHAYTEDKLVEQPAKAEPPSPQASPSGRGSTAVPLGRETKGEVVWVSRLSRPFAGLERLNPALAPAGKTVRYPVKL